ncbi:hypothetical protein MMC11_005196 [Xylographa trunciseda]|nr:hypothetical protein [Xylographa trunciseda]
MALDLSAQGHAPLVEQLQNIRGDLHGQSKSLDERTRKEALAVAKSIVNSLEKPEEVVMRYTNEVTAHRMSLRMGVELRLFHILVERNGTPISAAELADISKAELLLVVRIMRVISAIGFAKEAGVQSYVATPLTTAISTPALEAAMKICYDWVSTMQLPHYFQTHGYACPTDSAHCPFQWSHNTDLTFFAKIHENPEVMKDFNVFMKGVRSTREFWAEWFPVDEALIRGFSGFPDDILMVDVGGGNGHDLESFLKMFPQSKGHLILQDLPGTISNLTGLKEGIQAMSHDFFLPQPVKGARAYFTHFVMHNWPDEKCRDILRNLMSAMKPGYSKIVLNETVLPDMDCPSWFATNDVDMMAILAGLQRSRTQWIELLQSVDLEVVRIWTSPDGDDSEGIIEATLKDV